MLQSPLLTTPTSKSIAVEGISATILEQNADNYEILLEVNSNKMMIAMQGAFDAIEQFEIIAVRGFIVLTTAFIQTIKKLVQHLLCRLD